MTRPPLSAVRLSDAHDTLRPLLVLGPSLGTSAGALWGDCAALLAGQFDIVAWEVPGHGTGAPVAKAFSIADLAAAVLGLIDREVAARGEPGAVVHYAGNSLGAAVGLQLLADHGHRFATATLVATGATIGTPQGWSDRAASVRAYGTANLVESAAQRWFAPGFAAGEPGRVESLLHDLADADAESYALGCDALAGYDLRTRLAGITTPVLAVAGAHDPVTPPECLTLIATEVHDGRLVVLDSASHLAPVEAPAAVAELIGSHAGTLAGLYAGGMEVRRQVLGAAHVDRATAGADDLTREFQEFITRYAWGTIWTRKGLDLRSRSMITLTALIARGHHEELALHLRAALGNGLSRDEIKEVLLQSAIYCGVPAANTAFRIASAVFTELDAATGE